MFDKKIFCQILWLKDLIKSFKEFTLKMFYWNIYSWQPLIKRLTLKVFEVFHPCQPLQYCKPS